MPDQNNHIEILESRFPECSGPAFLEARNIVLKSGQSVLQSEGGVIYEVFPDGRRIPVKQIDPPTNDIYGRKISIR
jgi:hypothetical protein